MLLLSRTLAPPPGSIVKVREESVLPLSTERFDLALVYNPAPWLASPAARPRGGGRRRLRPGVR